MCLALSQHHAALAFSCALLCLSITLHSISCRSYSHVPSFASVLLSQVLCFVSASLTPFLLSLMCLICLVHCFVSTSRRSYVLRCLRVSRCSCSLCALLCPAQHHDALSSASPQQIYASASRRSCALPCLSMTSRRSCALPCLSMTSRRSCALPCLSMTSRRSSVLCLSSRYFSRLLATKLSNELEINGSEILYCPMN